ncbi:MAG: hypothetical protein U1G07_13555 [Verrucomicrobiota bacterium]
MIVARHVSPKRRAPLVTVLGTEAATVWVLPRPGGKAELTTRSSGVDFLAQMLAEALQGQLGQPPIDPAKCSLDRLFYLEEKDADSVGGPRPWRIAKEQDLRSQAAPNLDLPTIEAGLVVAALNQDNLVKLMERWSKRATPQLFVAIATDLEGRNPTALSDAHHGADQTATNAPASVLICDVPAIRRAGHRLREDNAVEALVVDVLEFINARLGQSPSPVGGARLFPAFRDIVVRLRLDAILHLHRKVGPQPEPSKMFSELTAPRSPLEQWDLTLIYTPEAADYLKLQDQGRIIGCRSIIAASVLAALTSAATRENEGQIVTQALQHAMQRCLELYHRGYPLLSDAQVQWGGQIWRQVTLREKVEASLKRRLVRWNKTLDPRDRSLADAKLSPLRPRVLLRSELASPAASLPLRLLARWWPYPSQHAGWSLLKEALYQRANSSNETQAQRTECARDLPAPARAKLPSEVRAVAEQIAAGGIANFAPQLRTLTVGKLIAIEREDVDNISSVQRLLRHFREDVSLSKPFSLAVFGAPGSGKSFGVKEASKGFPRERGGFHEPILEFNVSQFSSPHDLAKALHQVRDICLEGYIPIAFFDEFDSGFEGRRFGWLKYFLMPMQDGKFRDGEGVHNIGRAFFVFAGGVNLEYSEFSARVRDPEFCEAKGPDFLSRLRGFYNVPLLNRIEGEVDEENHLWHLHMIRRAVLLHSFKKMGLPEPDAPVLRAFLEVSCFRHGARSIQAILEMSSPNQAGRVDRSSLPRRDQLDIHVDPIEFRSIADRVS